MIVTIRGFSLAPVPCWRHSVLFKRSLEESSGSVPEMIFDSLKIINYKERVSLNEYL